MKYLAIIFLCLLTYVCYCKEDKIKKHYSDTAKVKNDLTHLTKTEKARSYLHPDVLNKTAIYIFNEFSKYCDSITYQSFFIDGTEYKNVIGSIGTQNRERIIVGAHYDVCGEQEGADDNGSGTAGILELSRLLSKEMLSYRIDFVCFTLEEPPFFRTNMMGSYVHAKSLYDNNIPIIGMVCLEMIGYFCDDEDSQEYPISLLKLFYGNKGDFITVVQKWSNGDFGSDFTDKMKELDLIKTKSFSGPNFIPGLDLSDHLNYWKFDYSAVMVTNTAFYRNKNYHTMADVMEILDVNRMCFVIDELFLSLKEICTSK